MIAADSSTVIAYFRGEGGRDGQVFDNALASAQLVLPPVVLMEVLSGPRLRYGFAELVPVIPVKDCVRRGPVVQ